MKKNLLTFLLCMLISVFVADAAKIYFQNTKNWSRVYAYTWTPSDEPTILDALTTVTVKGEDGEDMTLYVKETNKDNVIFLNKSSYMDSNKQETSQFKVVDGAVYSGNNAQIGKVTDIDNVLTFESTTPVEYASGIFASITNSTSPSYNAVYELLKEGSVYTLNSFYAGPSNGYIQLYKEDENGDRTYIGPTATGALISWPGITSTVEENTNRWGVGDAYYSISYDSENNTVTFTGLTSKFWGVFRSDAGVIGSPMAFKEAEDANYELTFNAGTDSQFFIFSSYGDQSWNEGQRWGTTGTAEITGTFRGWRSSNSTTPFLLDNEVPFGTWTVTLKRSENYVYFSRNVQAILVNGKASELTDGSWSGSLAEGDVVEFNINGTYYNLGALTTTDDGKNIYYSTTLVAGRDKEIVFSADEANIKLDGQNVIITAVNAYRPQMTVGTSTFELSQSGNFLVAYDVDITNNDAISFNVGGKNYVPEMPESIDYNAYTVTIPLKQEDGSASFANVQSGDKKTLFIRDTFKPNIRVAADASAVTFVWDAQTAVEAIEADAAVDAVYYNLQGIRVENPVNGLYVKVVNGKASKVRM